MFSRAFAAFLLLVAPAAADSGVEAAMALVKPGQPSDARSALESLVARDPGNARAWHELGMLWRDRKDTAAYRQAVECLHKAVALAPDNPTFLADYGGTAMELASRTRSLTAAIAGRAAMEKAVALAPDNIDAREGLFEFYARAPFLAGGSSSKAAAELDAIRRRDPDRATALAAIAKADARDYAAAFALCDEVLAHHPDDYTALYQYGRTASFSGQNLARGLACLQHALTLKPPGPASAQYTQVWYRIGTLQRKLGHAADARHAFTMALQLDPSNESAARALGKP